MGTLSKTGRPARRRHKRLMQVPVPAAREILIRSRYDYAGSRNMNTLQDMRFSTA